eukprot:7024456-Pyramimonas_sp.AAC.1
MSCRCTGLYDKCHTAHDEFNRACCPPPIVGTFPSSVVSTVRDSCVRHPLGGHRKPFPSSVR